MTTDPHKLPGADTHTGNREIDPVTGYDLTHHDWGGIRELNTPMPRIAAIALALTFFYSVVAWILLPAWPLGRDFTRGILGLDQGQMAMERFGQLADQRRDWLARFESADYAALAADQPLMARAIPAAQRLFADNCAPCHGLTASGGKGFPALIDADWLWSGKPEEIVVTLRHGINADDPDTRLSQMPAFDWMAPDERLSLAKFVADLPSGQAGWDSPEATLFAENCAACHGETAAGAVGVGAPSLVDHETLYGQDVEAVLHSLRYGRHGVMPAWGNRLSPAEINLLTVYLMQLTHPARGKT